MIRNIMEEIVSESLDGMLNEYDCCKCEQCVLDIKALSLNNLPPKYVAHDSGAAMVRFLYSRTQERAEVITAIGQAIRVVSQNPRHSEAD